MYSTCWYTIFDTSTLPLKNDITWYSNKYLGFLPLFLIVCVCCRLIVSSNFCSVINYSVNIITIAINNHVLTHKIITWSIKQHSANCKEEDVWLRGSVVWDWAKKGEASLVWGGQDECSAQPCLDPGKGEMREGMVGDKTTSANSMGHFSTDLEHCLSACHDRERQRSTEFDKYNLDKKLNFITAKSWKLQYQIHRSVALVQYEHPTKVTSLCASVFVFVCVCACVCVQAASTVTETDWVPERDR